MAANETIEYDGFVWVAMTLDGFVAENEIRHAIETKIGFRIASVESLEFDFDTNNTN